MKTALFLLSFALAANGAEVFNPENVDPAAAGMDPARLVRIPEKMKTYVDEGTASGFVTIVARHGRVASLEAVGFQDREAKTPMRPDTIFRIASMTKSLTVAGVMILIDEGKLNLLDPIEKFLPEYKGTNGSRTRPITVIDCMTHTSGLPGQGARGAEPFKSLAERVSAGGRTPLEAQPGTRWIYSQIGYAILGRLIEVCSGKSYEDFLHDRLFEPLGMKDTYFFLPPEKKSRQAAMYTLDRNNKLVRAPDSSPATVPTPEGGALTTALDMARFYQMLMNKGTLNGKRVLSPSAVEAMITNQTGDLKNVEFSPGLGMGLSFGVVKDMVGTFRYQSIGAFSKGGAFRTYGWGDPAKDLFGVILYQRTNGGGDTAPETNDFVILANAAIDK
jgi:CubicO group peptidase (beta-lactamase class C family)